MIAINCLYCNNPLKSSNGKYCSNNCQQNYQYELYIDNWKKGKDVTVDPSSFADTNYLEEKIDCIDIPYDSKSHDAHEFLDIKDNYAKIRYKAYWNASGNEINYLY